MNTVPDPLHKLLRDFCNMEWYETKELRAFVNNPTLTEAQRNIVVAFRQQLSEAIAQKSISPEQYLSITSEELSSNQDIALRLGQIEKRGFRVMLVAHNTALKSLPSVARTGLRYAAASLLARR